MKKIPLSQSILISGATGSFGSAFVERIVGDQWWKKIIVFSRDEQKHFRMMQQYPSNVFPQIRFMVGDVRDRDRLNLAMREVDVVVHAAAMKHVHISEYNPQECIATNITGAENIIMAALQNKVSKVVALSSDKAVDPVNLYGATKLCAEKLFQAANNLSGSIGTKFSIVRYGNVFMSNGSVIPKWLSMGDDVQITDPDATRYFMYLGQAVDLVLDTIREMPIEPAVPKLPAYRMADLAEAMNKKYTVIGLPEFEKKHESMKRGDTSEHAPRMTVAELREALNGIAA
jgi:UDP-N-acetylglucosamine 4,6-dehydratase